MSSMEGSPEVYLPPSDDGQETITALAQRARELLEASSGQPVRAEGLLEALREIERLGAIADERTRQVEEVARLVSRPHCKFGPDEVVGAVQGLLMNLHHSEPT